MSDHRCDFIDTRLQITSQKRWFIRMHIFGHNGLLLNLGSRADIVIVEEILECESSPSKFLNICSPARTLCWRTVNSTYITIVVFVAFANTESSEQAPTSRPMPIVVVAVNRYRSSAFTCCIILFFIHHTQTTDSCTFK